MWWNLWEWLDLVLLLALVRMSVVGMVASPWTALKKRASRMLWCRSSSDCQPKSCSMAVTLLHQDESPTTKPAALRCTLSSSVMSFLGCGSQTEALYSIMKRTKVKYALAEGDGG